MVPQKRRKEIEVCANLPTLLTQPKDSFHLSFPVTPISSNFRFVVRKNCVFFDKTVTSMFSKEQSSEPIKPKNSHNFSPHFQLFQDVKNDGKTNKQPISEIHKKTSQKSVASSMETEEASNTDDSIGDSGLVVSGKDYKSYLIISFYKLSFTSLFEI